MCGGEPPYPPCIILRLPVSSKWQKPLLKSAAFSKTNHMLYRKLAAMCSLIYV